MSAKKVLCVNSAPFVGGAEVSMMETAAAIDVSKYTMQFAVPAEGEYSARLRAQGFQVHILGVRSPNTHRWANPIKTVRMVKRVVRSEGVDLIHCNSFPYLMPAVVAARACRVPLVLHVRDMIAPGWFRLHHNWLIKRVDKILCITKKVAEPFGHLPNVRVVYNGIDPERYLRSNGQLRRLLDIKQKTFLVGIVGYILPRKGHEALIEAGLRLLERYPDMKFVVIGDDPFPEKGFKRRLLDTIKAAHRETSFVFTGSFPELSGVYADLNVLTMPSWEEPFGRAAIEAMAAGVPVVACPTGGVPEIFEHEITGLFVPPRDAQVLADAIARLHDDPALAERLRENAKEMVQQRFHIRSTATKVAEAYDELLEKRK